MIGIEKTVTESKTFSIWIFIFPHFGKSKGANNDNFYIIIRAKQKQIINKENFLKSYL